MQNDILKLKIVNKITIPSTDADYIIIHKPLIINPKSYPSTTNQVNVTM